MCRWRGSSHSYSLVWGWSRAYPETTGYLIPTLLAWGDWRQDERCLELARQWAEWLVGLQQREGFWAGGVVGGQQPSVFNTAMIVDGLSALAERMPDAHFAAESAYRGLAWLLVASDADGAWRQGLYVPGFTPAYYAYAVAAALRSIERLHQWRKGEELLRRATAYYARHLDADGTLVQAGFHPGPWAFTHTIAYALQGLWEAALYFEEVSLQQRVLRACCRWQMVMQERGRVGGRYRQGWKGDYSFTCPLGNAQLSVLFRKVGSHAGAIALERWADWLLHQAVEHQYWGTDPNRRGALPGSVPLWGPYLRWRYPNWGAKFLLDALLAALISDGVE